MKKYLLVISLAIIVLIGSLNFVAATDIIKMETIIFEESQERNRSKSIEIPNLRSVELESINTGNAELLVDGNIITINVNNGDISRTEYDPVKYSKSVTDYSTSSSNSFSSNKSYSDGDGYSGSLDKNGASYLYSGSYTSADSKYVTGQTSSYYSSGGYSGSLSSYLYSGTYTPDTSKTATASRTSEGSNSNPSSVSYSSGGYVGTLYSTGTSTTKVQTGGSYDSKYVERQPSSYYNKGGYSGTLSSYQVRSDSGLGWNTVYRGTVYTADTRTWRTDYTTSYSGTVTIPGSGSDTRVYRYQGTVYRPESDTRVYRQNYSGTAYKAGYDNYYSYTVVLSYVDNQDPLFTINDKDIDIIVNDSGSISIKGTIKDNDNDEVTISASIDGILKSTVVTDTVSQKNWVLEWRGNELNQGTYSGIEILADDDNGGVITEKYTGTILVDKTSPTITITDNSKE